MSTTDIEWTRWPGTIGSVWNIVTGCNKVDRGCKNCYAEIMHGRLMYMQPAKYRQPFLAGAVMHPELLNEPDRWRKPRTVFVNSMSDLFHVQVTFEFLEQAFDVMDRNRAHTFLILTKRPERALAFQFWMRARRKKWRPSPNVVIGTSANDQPSAETRVPLLLLIDVDRRFLSYEPATGALDITFLDAEKAGHQDMYRINALTGDHTDMGRPCTPMPRLHWIICGGESGNKATPMHPDWARGIRDACEKYKVPFFFKQWGRWEPMATPQNMKDVQIATNINGKTEFIWGNPYRTQYMRKVRRKDSHHLDGKAHRELPISSV